MKQGKGNMCLTLESRVDKDDLVTVVAVATKQEHEENQHTDHWKEKNYNPFNYGETMEKKTQQKSKLI